MTGNIPKGKATTIYERMLLIRTVYGDNQKEFAKRLELPQSQISYMESGQREPNIETVIKLGEFGWDMEWILKGESAEQQKDFGESNVNKKAIMGLLNHLQPKEITYVRKALELYVKSKKEEAKDTTI
jgi:transcriptional regulator with XRE-family HTH domain